MIRNVIKIGGIFLFASMLSLTFNGEEYFMKLDKRQFNKREVISGKAFINPDGMKAIVKKMDLGYSAFDDEYNVVSNAVQLRIARNDKNYWDGYVLVKDAIIVKNDTAYFSFKVPESLIKTEKAQKLELKVNRQWNVQGKDTILGITRQFEVVE